MKDCGKPLRLEWRTPAELEDNPSNWRQHPEAQTAGLEAVIADVGWAGALLYNEETGRLIDGHARKKLPADLAVDGRVPVLVGSWTEEQEKLILATLDPIAGMAEADVQALASLLGAIESEDASIADLVQAIAQDTGADAILNPPGEDDEAPIPTSEEEAAALVEKWGTELGQVWTIAKHRMMCGDSTSVEDVATLLDGAKPLMMTTDPPYGVNYDPEWRNLADAKLGGLLAGHRRKSGLIRGDATACWTASWRLFAGAVAYVWHAGIMGGEVLADLAEANLLLRTQIIWRKPNFVISRGHYHSAHECCWYAVRKGENASWIGDRKQSTIWDVDNEVGRKEGAIHSTQKPLELFRRPIRNHDAPEVYDPFGGTGTAMVACEELGRRCFTMEIDPVYVAVTLERCDIRGIEPIAKLETQGG